MRSPTITPFARCPYVPPLNNTLTSTSRCSQKSRWHPGQSGGTTGLHRCACAWASSSASLSLSTYCTGLCLLPSLQPSSLLNNCTPIIGDLHQVLLACLLNQQDLVPLHGKCDDHCRWLTIVGPQVRAFSLCCSDKHKHQLHMST